MGVNLIAAIPAGLLGDWIGYKRAMLLGMVLVLVSIPGIVFSASPAGLILFSLLGDQGNSLV